MCVCVCAIKTKISRGRARKQIDFVMSSSYSIVWTFSTLPLSTIHIQSFCDGVTFNLTPKTTFFTVCVLREKSQRLWCKNFSLGLFDATVCCVEQERERKPSTRWRVLDDSGEGGRSQRSNTEKTVGGGEWKWKRKWWTQWEWEITSMRVSVWLLPLRHLRPFWSRTSFGLITTLRAKIRPKLLFCNHFWWDDST